MFTMTGSVTSPNNDQSQHLQQTYLPNHVLLRSEGSSKFQHGQELFRLGLSVWNPGPVAEAQHRSSTDAVNDFDE